MTRLTELRHQWQAWQKTKAIPRCIPQLPLQHGWLLNELIGLDDLIWGRWHYWAITVKKGDLLTAPIPKIQFTSQLLVRQHLEHCLDCIPNQGTGRWQSWSSTEYIEFFLDWLLFGLGHKGQPRSPIEPCGCQGAGDRLLKTFDLSGLMLFPQDYWGDLLADIQWGKANQFYPTHLNLCVFKAETLMAGKTDSRRERAVDPCCGTGRMIMVLSNYVLTIYGMDISQICAKATLVNCALFAPWVYRPFQFLDQPKSTKQLADEIFAAGQTDPLVATNLEDTEQDEANQWRFEPIMVRHKRGGTSIIIGEQGCFF
ncbi:hypothetical protein ACQ4M3_24295 [Leptolyngbya sp. AN03gr2]|uniref:hypothetical protein n=1 Tax=unclassified Leptolyngbya TaxID=2650499 RepID=UPI003D31ABCF